MWFKYYKGYYDVRKLELELVSWRDTFGPKQRQFGIFIRSRGFLRANSLGQVKEWIEWRKSSAFEEDVGVCRNAIEIPRGLSTLERGRPITAFYRNCFFEFLLRQLLRRYCTAPLYLLPASSRSACLPDNEARRRHSTSHSSTGIGGGLCPFSSRAWNPAPFKASWKTIFRLCLLSQPNRERCKNSSSRVSANFSLCSQDNVGWYKKKKKKIWSDFFSRFSREEAPLRVFGALIARLPRATRHYSSLTFAVITIFTCCTLRCRPNVILVVIINSILEELRKFLFTIISISTSSLAILLSRNKRRSPPLIGRIGVT